MNIFRQVSRRAGLLEILRRRRLDEDEWDNEDEGETWNSFDTTSSRLFKQVSKIKGKLTLQLNFLFMTSGPVKFDQLLNQFSEYCESDISFTEVPFKCYVGPVPLAYIRSNPSTRLHLDGASEVPLEDRSRKTRNSLRVCVM